MAIARVLVAFALFLTCLGTDAARSAPSVAVQDRDRLQAALEHYEGLAAAGGWPVLPAGPTLEMGDHGGAVDILRRRLEITGDFDGPTSVQNGFTADLERAVRRFQARHGLKVDGLVGPETRQALNVSASRRVQQLRLNLRRARQSLAWPNDYIMINAPGFALTAVFDGEAVWQSRVIVGKRRTPTPELSGQITRIVLNPYWNVPRSIAVNEMIPKVRKDQGFLARNSIRVLSGWSESARVLDPRRVDWSKAAARGYRFRQDPGPKNALGRIKFLFDNRFGVYLHDTPSKTLFERPQRTFSHGCMRLQNPDALAALLLQDEPGWTADSLRTALDSGRNRQIRLRRPIDIFVVYWTAWVDSAGQVQFRRDVYGRDRGGAATAASGALDCEP